MYSGLQSPEQQEATATKISWQMPYVGSDHEVFADTIRAMKRAQPTTGTASILPVIQSSGTGKSRLLHEVAGLVVTLPLNVRSALDTTAYPAPDRDVARLLTDVVHLDPRAMEYVQLAFLTKLFAIAALYLTEMHPNKVYVDEAQLALDWRSYLDADDRRIRKELYARAIKEAETECKEAVFSMDWKDAVYVAFEGLKRTASNDGPDAFLSAIESRLHNGLRHPEVAALVYVDESHELAYKLCDKSAATNAYTTFTRAFHHLSKDRPIFLAAMSTDPVIRNNGTSVPRFQEPYTELPFDCLLDGEPFFKRGTMTLRDVVQDEFMVKFGRPMFSTRWKASLEFNGLSVRESVLLFALVKLTCRQIAALRKSYRKKYYYRHEEDQGANMAAICTRLSVDLNRLSPWARELEKDMVTRNMRIAFSIPHNPGDWLRQTGTPSEPLLAEAAAMFMNEFFDKAKVVEHLHWQLKRGVIQPDIRGELVARALLTFAHDQALATCYGQFNARYGTAVPVLTFLKELFAERWHADVLSARPDMAAEGSKTLEEAFSGAFVRFTHFVKSGEGELLDTFAALAAVARGMAFRRTEKHAAYDIAIPVVMEDTLLDDHLMTYIFIRLNGQYYSPPFLDRSLVDEIFPSQGTHPYIFINMHPGGAEQRAWDAYARETAADRSSPHPEHPGYRITIAGCSDAVFAVVDDKSMGDQLAALIHTPVDAVEEAELAKERASGSAEMRQRMKSQWNRGPECYDWADEPVMQQVPPAETHEFIVVHG